MIRLACALALFSSCVCKGPASSVDAGPSVAWLDGTPSAETGPTHDGGGITIRAMSEPNGLNTLEDGSRDAWTLRITQRLVVEGLLEIDPTTYELRPALATSWQESADHTTSTFQLRKGVRFHDGAAFTAADVVATLDALFRGQHPTGALKGELSGLESWRAVDDFTVELRWRAPSPFALRALAKFPILSAPQLAQAWESIAATPNGTGPFAVASWEHGTSLTLKRSNTWWAGQVPLDAVTFRFVKDHTVAAGLAEKGEFDVMTNVPPAMWRAIEGPSGAWAQRAYRRLRATDNSFSYIAWNEAHPPLDDVRVRRALAALYPSASVTRLVDLGLEVPTNCPFTASGNGCASDAGIVDVATATQLLSEADAGGLSIPILIPATALRLAKLIPLYAERAQLAGIELKSEPVDIATMTARVRSRSFVAASRVWTEFDAEQDLFPLFHSSQIDGGSNFAGYSNAEVDQLLTAIRAEWNVERRRELEVALHRALVETQPFLIMSARQSLDLVKTRVHGLTPSLVWYDLRAAWVEN